MAARRLVKHAAAETGQTRRTRIGPRPIRFSWTLTLCRQLEVVRASGVERSMTEVDRRHPTVPSSRSMR